MGIRQTKSNWSMELGLFSQQKQNWKIKTKNGCHIEVNPTNLGILAISDTKKRKTKIVKMTLSKDEDDL